MPDDLGADRLTARKHFFLKKEAKTFVHESARRSRANALLSKVFWFFFQTRTAFCLICGGTSTRSGSTRS
jgi:hypothetical protein